MAMLPKIERIDDRLAVIVPALTAAFDANGTYPFRHVTRNRNELQQQDEAQLEQGIIIVLAAAESDYSQQLGKVARDGKLELVLIGHLRVAEDAAKSEIEDREIALIEDLKSFFRGGTAGLSYQVNEFRSSLQLYHPYGFIVGSVLITNPTHTQS